MPTQPSSEVPNFTPQDFEASRTSFESILDYWEGVKNDPLRLQILAVHAVVEQMIEILIADAIPHSECFEVPDMWFRDKLKVARKLGAGDLYGRVWDCIEKLANLRNSAAHRNYENERNERFAALRKSFSSIPLFDKIRDSQELETLSPEALLDEVTMTCVGLLVGVQNYFRRLRRQEAANRNEESQ